MVNIKAVPKDPDIDLSPLEIKRIRESLGLSQVEAGETLGGGPRAFQKYENGDIRPSASVLTLLKILRADPTALLEIVGPKVTPIEGGAPGPFQIDGRHIHALKETKLVECLRRLLSAEARAHELPLSGIHVASNIKAPDGGEDARIEWHDGPDRTPHLPARFTLFQVKATDLTPRKAAKELLSKDGSIKPAVREALSNGAAYTVICNQPYTHQEILARKAGMLEVLNKAAISVTPAHIHFLDADQLAQWANLYPGVSEWILEQTQPGLTGPFRSWSHWAGRHDHASVAWVEDKRLPKFRDSLRARVLVPQTASRILGLSGVGKSRLVLEALAPSADEEKLSQHVSDIVLYAIEADVGRSVILEKVQAMADAGGRTVIVVDRCPEETHLDLSAIVKRSGSKLSLVSIDHEFTDRREGGDTIIVDRADDAIIEGILRNIIPHPKELDLRRLVGFSAGFPQIAVLIGQSWRDDISIAGSPDDALINRIVRGRSARENQNIDKAAQVVSAFGLIGIKGDVESNLSEAAALTGVPVEDLRSSIDDLRIRGVVQQRGRFVTLQPAPIALALADRQWRTWSGDVWDRVLFGEMPVYLKTNAARQLALLNTRDISTEVCRHVCRLNGPLTEPLALFKNDNARVLALLAEIDGATVLRVLEYLLSDVSATELKSIVAGETRRHLVYLLAKTMFVEQTFERGAKLMLDLAVAENETWSNNATGEFLSAFSMLGASTEAGLQARLSILDEAIASGEQRRIEIAISALEKGIATHSGFRIIGAEEQGSRPTLRSWRPKTTEEAILYVTEFLGRLASLAASDGPTGEKARIALGSNMRGLVMHRVLDEMTQAVHKVIAARGKYWPQALDSLNDALACDLKGMDKRCEKTVRTLVAELSPDALSDQVRYLVSEMPWDYPQEEEDFSKRDQKKREAVDNLVQRLIQDEAVLNDWIPRLSRGEHRMAFVFGQSLARRVHDQRAWYQTLLAAVQEVPDAERNFGALLGFLDILNSSQPEVIADLKRLASGDAGLAPALPMICSVVGITKSDVDLCIGAMADGVLKPASLSMLAMGGVLSRLSASELSPLFDALLGRDDRGYWVGIDLIGMYAHGRPGVLEELRGQLRTAAEKISFNSKPTTMDRHHFKELMLWLLRRGRGDPDARATALAMTKHLIDAVRGGDYHEEQFFAELLPVMLTDFQEVSWQLIGQALASDQRTAWHFENLLSNHFSMDERSEAPIARVSEDILFAWCHANPEVGPAFLAKVFPLLARDDGNGPRRFHPTIIRLLDEFGQRPDVTSELDANMHTFGWTGSRSSYYAIYERPLRDLANHPIAAVRRWSKRTWAELQRLMSLALQEDEERNAF